VAVHWPDYFVIKGYYSGLLAFSDENRWCVYNAVDRYIYYLRDCIGSKISVAISIAISVVMAW
jgi:hypothetical protein